MDSVDYHEKTNIIIHKQGFEEDVPMNPTRGFTLFLSFLVATLAFPTSVRAGDPDRIWDRGFFPAWAATFREGTFKVAEGGELIDAIRFELVRGYPWKYSNGGYEDREFLPDRVMTRAEFAAVLSRSQGLDVEDSQSDPWYGGYIAALVEQGIIASATSNDWEAPITRLEAGQWMGRAAEVFGADDRNNSIELTDVDDPLVHRAIRAGVLMGTSETKFEPERPLNRVEAAVMVMRLARARNSQGNLDRPEVLAVVEEVVRQADMEIFDQTKRWALQGYFDPLELGTSTTQEYVDQLMRGYVLLKRMYPHRERTYVVRSDYRFEVLELHDTTAILRFCAWDRVYRASDPPEKPFGEGESCGRRYLVLRDGHWLVAAHDGVYSP